MYVILDSSNGLVAHSLLVALASGLIFPTSARFVPRFMHICYLGNDGHTKCGFVNP